MSTQAVAHEHGGGDGEGKPAGTTATTRDAWSWTAVADKARKPSGAARTTRKKGSQCSGGARNLRLGMPNIKKIEANTQYS